MRRHAVARSAARRKRDATISAQLAAARWRHRVGRSRATDDVLGSLVSALRRSPDSCEGAERAAIDRIEALRRRLLEDDSELEIVDFGAGTPDADRSIEVAAAGLVTRRIVSEVCATSASRPANAFVLFSIARALHPETVVELGTNLGIGAAYLAAALDLDGGGRLWTFEGAPALAGAAERNLDDVGLAPYATVVVGPFVDTLEALSVARPVDFVYIDGHHDGDATVSYFDRIREVARSGAVFAFDDIRWNASMFDGWSRIRRAPSVAHAIDAGELGYVILS